MISFGFFNGSGFVQLRISEAGAMPVLPTVGMGNKAGVMSLGKQIWALSKPNLAGPLLL